MNRIIKNYFGLLCICLIAPSGVFAQSSANASKPNVIIINADDLGYGDVGAYGATKVETPNMDRLATEGRRFTDFHSASAVCSPSRYALITGEYPSRRDFWSAIFLRHPLVVDTAKTTIADVMKSTGYATAAIGKWHLGFGDQEPVNWNAELKPGPLELGFDYYFGVPVLNSHPPFVYIENHRVVGLTKEDPLVYGEKANTRFFDEKFGLNAIGGADSAHALYQDRKVGTTLKNKAVSWINNHCKEPFFLYFATTNIHHPFTPAPQFIGSSEAGRYGDFIEELDWMIGELLQTLDDQGLTENTLVILTSDNGGMLNRGGQTAYESGHHQNGPLLGFKFDAWEGGHRVPFIARWPGHIPANSTSDELLANTDFLATLADLLGNNRSDSEGPDSFNMLPALTDSPKKPIRNQLVISPWNKNNLAIRKGKWMYIPRQGGGGFTAEKPGIHDFGGAAAFPFTGAKNSNIANGKIKENAPPAQLYNLEKDRNQKVNLYSQYPDTVKALQQLLQKVLEADNSHDIEP